jgi:hypothetical protein
MEGKEGKKEELPSGLHIRISVDNEDTIEFIDNIDLPEEYKKETLYPYLKHLYQDLAQRGSDPSKGIEKAVLVEVCSNWHHVVSGDTGDVGRQALSLVRRGGEQLCGLARFFDGLVPVLPVKLQREAAIGVRYLRLRHG